METIIKKYQFDNYSDVDDRLTLKEALDEVLRALSEESAGKITNEAVAALSALTEKVSSKDFPPDGSDAAHMAQTVFKVAEFLTENIVPTVSKVRIVSKEESARLQSKLKDKAFGLLLACFHHGPTSGHLELINDMLKSSLIDLSSYLKNLEARSSEMKALLVAIRQDYTPRDFEKSSSRFRSTVSNVLKTVVDRLSAHEELVDTRRKEIVDLYMNSIHRSALTPEENAKIHQGFLDVLHKKFSPGGKIPSECFIFSSCTKASTLAVYLEQFKQHISVKDFPRHETAVTTATSGLRCFLVVYRRQDTEGRVCDAVKLVSYCCVLKKKPLVTMAENLASDFQHFSKDLIISQKRSILQSIQEETQIILRESEPGDDLVTAVINIYTYLALPAWIDESDSSLMIGALPFLLRCPHASSLKLCLKILKSKGKIINWKTDIEAARQVVRAFADVMVSPYLDSEDRWREVIEVREMVDIFLTQTRKKKVVEELHPQLFELIQKVLDNPTYAGSDLLPRFEDFIQYTLAFPKPACSTCDICKKSMESLHAIIEKCCSLLESKDTAKAVANFNMAIFSVLQCIISQVSETPQAAEFSVHVNRILTMLFEGPYEDDDGGPETKVLLASPALVFVNANATNPAAIEGLVPSILRLSGCECGQVKELVSQIGLMALQQCPQVLSGHLDKLYSTLQEEGHMSIINCIQSMYTADIDRDVIHAKLGQLVDYMLEGKLENQLVAFMFLIQVAKTSGKNIKAQQIQQLEELLVHPKLIAMSLELFRSLADTNPEVVAECKALVYNIVKKDSKFSAMVGIILTQTSMNVKSMREETVEYLLDGCVSGVTSDKIVHLGRLKLLALQEPALLAKHRPVIDELKKDPNLTGDCRYIIDAIEGRNLEELRAEIEAQQKRLRTVSSAVRQTEQQIDSAQLTLSAQAQELQHVKGDVREAKKKVDTVQSDLTETKRKVEEIDHKSVSNAPTWSRDVSELLNVPSGSDWRHLAQNLGYSTAEVRAWMTQPDPCMSVLSEWFATHNTADATQAVLKALRKINRGDAETVIQAQVEKTKEMVVEEEGKVVGGGPVPPVFLSYDWADQEQVKLLKEHLSAAGFGCWMDIGQMGGGDRLMKKVDAGMRGAKVVVCCISENYTKSEHCNKEANLSSALAKPIIPVMLEKVTWPPEGSLGPLLSEYLFIRLYAKEVERGQVKEGVFWTTHKMKELLMQISYHVTPAEQATSGEYRNWWCSDGQLSEAESQPSQQKNHLPSLFLSYQWGKQAEVQALYRRLTALGYSCWMDVHQMGGGDSLYEKIDRGIRQSDVMICCLTQKYCISANCRKEVSLADALNKPMIPLMLESIEWPPTGPMSLALTQVPYVNCVSQKLQQSWEGGEFAEVVARLESYQKSDANRDTGSDPDNETSEGSFVREGSEFDARKKWRKMRNVGQATVALNKVTSKTCVVM